MKGRLALALENTASVNSFFGRRALLHKEVETPEEVFKKVDEVGVDGIYEVAKDLFKPGKLGLAIIGPYNNKEKFKKLVS
jgi:predicted Zn-dependent peptidase